MTLALHRWQPESAKATAVMAPTYLRHVYGCFGIEQGKRNPSLDSQRPGS